MNKKTFKLLFLTGFSSILFFACAATGGVAGNERVQIYSQSLQRMTEITEMAIKGGGFKINKSYKSSDGSLTIVINNRAYYSNEGFQGSQGAVIIEQWKNGKIRIEVKNPDYHFTVPRYEREKYHRVIFDQINAILAEDKQQII